MIAAALGLLMTALGGCSTESPVLPEPAEDPVTGLFSWDESVMEGNARAELYLAVSVLGINELYQSFDGLDAEDAAIEEFVQDMDTMDVKLFRLDGEPEWGLAEGREELIACVRETAEWGELWGMEVELMLDVEPYLLDGEWDADSYAVLESFTHNMEAAFEEASSLGIELKLCIPAWYERVSEELLETLIGRCCDAVAVMNYDRTSEKENMELEVELARQYGREIICIFEFQEVGKHSLTPEQTYNEDGIAAGLAGFEALWEEFDYSGLGFAYHYLSPLVGLLHDYAVSRR